MPQHGSCAGKLPVHEWHGNHAAPAQVADKAEGRVSAAGRERCTLLPQRLYCLRGPNATTGPSLHSAVTAPRNAATIRCGADRIYVGAA